MIHSFYIQDESKNSLNILENNGLLKMKQKLFWTNYEHKQKKSCFD